MDTISHQSFLVRNKELTIRQEEGIFISHVFIKRKYVNNFLTFLMKLRKNMDISQNITLTWMRQDVS